MAGGGSKQSGEQTQSQGNYGMQMQNSTSTKSPWDQAQQYAVGQNGHEGIMPKAEGLFQDFHSNASPWKDAIQNTAGAYVTDLAGRTWQNAPWQQLVQQQMPGVAGNMLGGGYNAQITPAQGVSVGSVTPERVSAASSQGGGGVTPERIEAERVSPVSARAMQGELDPTNALKKLLSGQVDNPYLAGMQQAATGTAQQQYQDNILKEQQSLNYNVMPGLRSGAIGAGQYGGSRQGIAEGLAAGLSAQTLGQNARDLGIASMNAGSQLYGNAYEGAQGRMYGTANALDQRALDAATGNANRSLQASLANQSTELQGQIFNASQAQQNNQFNANLGQQASLTNAANDLQGQQFNANLGLQGGQFNANLGLQNNSQAMTNAGMNVANATAGANLAGLGLNSQNAMDQQSNANWQQQLSATAYPANYVWGGLQNYNSVLYPYSTVGGTTNTNSFGVSQGAGQSSQPTYTNPAAGGLGGAGAGLGMAKDLGWGGMGQGLSALGGGVLGALSQRAAKLKLGGTDGAAILDAIKTLDVDRWAYRPDTGLPGDAHVGPYAEDFARAFGVGDGTGLPFVDAIGVLFAAVKELANRQEANAHG